MIYIILTVAIIALAMVAGYYARRLRDAMAGWLDCQIAWHREMTSVSKASTELNSSLRSALSNIGYEYERIKAHSVVRCAKCGRLNTWKQVADIGNYYVCENCEAKQWK